MAGAGSLMHANQLKSKTGILYMIALTIARDIVIRDYILYRVISGSCCGGGRTFLAVVKAQTKGSPSPLTTPHCTGNR